MQILYFLNTFGVHHKLVGSQTKWSLSHVTDREPSLCVCVCLSAQIVIFSM